MEESVVFDRQDTVGYDSPVVDRWFPSSKTCSTCGRVQEKKCLWLFESGDVRTMEPLRTEG
ncbi:hypothetical protein A7Q09_10250 [Methylacidiphilum sp. Yel]|nr:hypothetical protein A7Q09_10250 [Methylacidiphilum sp. Yel]